MKADPAKAQSVGSRLVLYKDSLAKSRVGVLDTADLQAILKDTSPDPLAAEHELVMAWRFYTQEREQQIACGEFRVCSSPDEIVAARRFSRAKEIVFDSANVKGVACVISQIATAIEIDILIDAIKWKAVQAQDEELVKIFEDRWNPKQPPAMDTEQDSVKRKEFAEGSLRWCKSKSEHQFRKYYGHRIDDAIRAMLEAHRDYWTQHPTEPYDDSALNHVFAFSLCGGNYGLSSLSCAWDRYLEHRIDALGIYRREPFTTCTDEEREIDKEERRKRPIEWHHSHPNAREIIESHIRTIIREDILADIPKWERYKREVEDTKKRAQELRLERIQKYRDAFVSRVFNMFGQQVLEMISQQDVERYSEGIVDRRERKEDLWYSILKKYQFDGNTKSCLYFIRQGDAIKIGITAELDRRFAQIKTSAAGACKIENVVYTHHGRTLESKLHQSLALYNSHLEWFVLPPNIEKMLFSAKSVEDIENVLKCLSGNI